MKESIKKEWPILLLLLAPFITSMIIWDLVPETVPIHFNIYGEADDFGPKWIILYLIPAIAISIYLMLLLLPHIDPKKRIKSSQKPIAAIRVVTSVFFVGLYIIIVLISMGEVIAIETYIVVAVGFLFLIIGNYLNSVKQNYFIGIRTPWALENSTVWKKTHRLGSKIWMIGGIIILLSPLLGLETILGISIILIAAIPMVFIPVIYSYIAYKKIES